MCILQHHNIVALFAIVFEIGHYGIVMEYVPHGTLEDFVFNYDVWRSVFDLFSFVCVSQSLYCCVVSVVISLIHMYVNLHRIGLIVVISARYISVTGRQV